MRQRLVNRPRFAYGAAPLICVIVLALGAARSFADCVPQWIPAPGQPGMNDRVTAMTVFDDGSGGGPALIVGGRFTMAGGVSRLAKWTGTSWQPFGSNLPFAEVLALAVYDRGNGPELYAAGFGIVRWNGSAWVAVPNAPASWIGALYVHDGGEGPELYVSGGFGSFPTIDGPTDYVARWNGTNWRSVGHGLVSVVQEFATFNDGIGPALFAVGSFCVLQR